MSSPTVEPRKSSPSTISLHSSGMCAYAHSTFAPRDILLDHRFPVPEASRREEPSNSNGVEKSILPGTLCEAALDAVVSQYEFVVAQEVSHFYMHRSFGDHEDLLQEGRVLLLRSARRYRPGRTPQGNFTGFARICIRNGLRDLIRWISRDSARTWRATTAGALLSADQFGNVHPLYTVEYAQAYQPDLAWAAAEESEGLHHLIRALPARHQAVIQLAYVNDWSLRQIAEYFELSRTRVHQILQESLARIRTDYLEVESNDASPPADRHVHRVGDNGQNGAQRGERGATGRTGPRFLSR